MDEHTSIVSTLCIVDHNCVLYSSAHKATCIPKLHSAPFRTLAHVIWSGFHHCHNEKSYIIVFFIVHVTVVVIDAVVVVILVVIVE